MPRFLIHGWATNATIWPNWLLSTKTCCYQSPHYPDYSKLVTAFLDHYDQHRQPIDLIGWSLGGMLALQLAAEHPDKINNLILISSTPRFTIGDDYFAGLPTSIVKNLARKLLKNPRQTQLDFYQLMFTTQEQVSNDTFIIEQAPLLANLETPTLQNGLNYLLETDLRFLLSSIQVPCHIFHGTEDGICPLEAGNYLASHLPNATLTLISGAGHMPFYTQSNYCKSQLLTIIAPMSYNMKEAALYD